jgi:hypothetical protein
LDRLTAARDTWRLAFFAAAAVLLVPVIWPP